MSRFNKEAYELSDAEKRNLIQLIQADEPCLVTRHQKVFLIT